MSFITQTNPDGSPNASAAFVNAVLIVALYRGQRAAWDTYAGIAGARVVHFESNPLTFDPDVGVLLINDQALVALGGTTNKPQWSAHVLSAFFPLADNVTENTVVGSMYTGEQTIESILLDSIRPARRGTVLVTGHSYGAGAAKIFMDHLYASEQQPEVGSLLTFGEPKSGGKFFQAARQYAHTRIIASKVRSEIQEKFDGMDPVAFAPPGILMCPKWPLITIIPLGALGFGWEYDGNAFEINIGGYQQTEVFNGFFLNLDPVNWFPFVTNLPNVGLHFMDSSYLPKALVAYQRTGLNPELAPLVPIAQNFINGPIEPAPNLGPPIPSPTLNTAFGYSPDTITDANRADFATISASASQFFPGNGGSTGMPAPIIPLTLKGTLFLEQSNGGSSISFYANPTVGGAPTTLQAMIAAIQSIGQTRSGLSQCGDVGGCTNPLTFRAIRADDTTTKRKSLLVTATGILPISYGQTGNGPIGPLTPENDENNVAVKVTFRDQYGNNAIMYQHAVPLMAQISGVNQLNAPPQYDARFAPLTPLYFTNLNNFCNQIRSLGLGLRYATVQWTPMGQPVGVPPNQVPATGNGTPVAVQYSQPGTPVNTYTFQMPIPANPVLGKFRVIVREMKALRVLNGRWPALGFMNAGLYYVNVRRNAANYLPYDNNGYLSPEVWSVMTPLVSGTGATADGPGITAVELTEKKVGRPFDLQRGRRRNAIV